MPGTKPICYTDPRSGYTQGVVIVSVSVGSFGNSLAILMNALMTLFQVLGLQIALYVPGHTQFQGASVLRPQMSYTEWS